MQQYILGNLAEKTLYIKSFILVVYDVRDEMKDLLDERKSIVTLTIRFRLIQIWLRYPTMKQVRSDQVHH